MSYARFGADSDVYIFVAIDGICCCGCSKSGSQTFPTTAAAIAHLHEHIAQGDIVPDDVIPALLADATENDYFIANGHWAEDSTIGKILKEKKMDSAIE